MPSSAWAQRAGLPAVWPRTHGPELTAGADFGGTGTFTWVPDRPHVHSVVVRSVTASGVASGPAYLALLVNP